MEGDTFKYLLLSHIRTYICNLLSHLDFYYNKSSKMAEMTLKITFLIARKFFRMLIGVSDIDSQNYIRYTLYLLASTIQGYGANPSSDTQRYPCKTHFSLTDCNFFPRTPSVNSMSLIVKTQVCLLCLCACSHTSPYCPHVVYCMSWSLY